MSMLVNRQPITDEQLSEIKAALLPEFDGIRLDTITAKDAPDAYHVFADLECGGQMADGITRHGGAWCAFSRE